MTDYLSFELDTSDPAFVSAYDDMPLWSAMAGLLLLRHVPLRAGAAVLDAGCGTGFPLLEIADRLGPAIHVTGVDVWAPALERAAAKAKARGITNVEVRECDAASMPFEDASFDLIVSNLGLNNFDDALAVAKECARVLRPDGVIAITTNLVGHMREFYSVFASVLHDAASVRGDDAALDRLAAHIAHRATVDGVEALFKSAGLRVTRVERHDVPMRFGDGTAFLNSYFVKLAFLGAWKSVVEEDRHEAVFSEIESRLNAIAARDGELLVTVPIAYVEARR